MPHGTLTRGAGFWIHRGARYARGCWSPAPGRWSSRGSRLPGALVLRGAGVPFRSLGPLRRPARQARREHRDRRVGDPVRARRSRRGLAALRAPAHAAVGDAAQRAGDLSFRAAAVSAPYRRCSGRCAAAIYAARELLVLGFVKHPRAMKLLERVGRRHMSRSLKRSRRCARRRRPTTPSAASHPAVQRVVSGAGAGERRARHVRCGGDPRRTRSCRRRRELEVDH